MFEQKKQIGELFKTKRKELNLTLKEVENATSIKTLYLQAIEEGNVDTLLAHVYILGFLKQYASFLGLDGEKILKQYPLAFVASNERKDFEYGIGTMEVRNSHSSGVKFVPNALWIVLGAMALIGAWFFARALGVF